MGLSQTFGHIWEHHTETMQQVCAAARQQGSAGGLQVEHLPQAALVRHFTKYVLHGLVHACRAPCKLCLSIICSAAAAAFHGEA